MIVGGGVSGLSVACQLAQAGLAVTVLEASHLGSSASTRNQGWLHSGGWFAADHQELARMCLDSLKQTVSFCPECVEHGCDGMAYLFSNSHTDVSRWTSAWQSVGIEFSTLSPARLAEHLPGLETAEIHEAFLLPDRAMRPDLLVMSLAEAARNAGAEVCTESSVSRLVVEDQHVTGVELGTGETIGARLVILACNVQGVSLWPDCGDVAGRQSDYSLVPLKGHLIALKPSLGTLPFCVVDAEGLNHIPHEGTSVFGINRWQVVSQPLDHEPVEAEREVFWARIGQFFPSVDREEFESRFWAGTMIQAMHIEQIEPGQNPLPTVIDYATEPSCLCNLLNVFPGRSTLWPQLAEQTRDVVLDKLEFTVDQPVMPPWSA